jgi:hypothetical protein
VIKNFPSLKKSLRQFFSKTKRVFEKKNFPSLRNFPNLSKILRQKHEISRDGNKIPRQKYIEAKIARVSRVEHCQIKKIVVLTQLGDLPLYQQPVKGFNCKQLRAFKITTTCKRSQAQGG